MTDKYVQPTPLPGMEAEVTPQRIRRARALSPEGAGQRIAEHFGLPFKTPVTPPKRRRSRPKRFPVD